MLPVKEKAEGVARAVGDGGTASEEVTAIAIRPVVVIKVKSYLKRFSLEGKVAEGRIWCLQPISDNGNRDVSLTYQPA